MTLIISQWDFKRFYRLRWDGKKIYSWELWSGKYSRSRAKKNVFTSLWWTRVECNEAMNLMCSKRNFSGQVENNGDRQKRGRKFAKRKGRARWRKGVEEEQESEKRTSGRRDKINYRSLASMSTDWFTTWLEAAKSKAEQSPCCLSGHHIAVNDLQILTMILGFPIINRCVYIVISEFPN